MSVHLSPEEIEAESFRIIEAELGPHSWSAQEWPIVRRAIHTASEGHCPSNTLGTVSNSGH